MTTTNTNNYIYRDILYFFGGLISILVLLCSSLLPKGLSTLGVIVGIAIFVILSDSYLKNDDVSRM